MLIFNVLSRMLRPLCRGTYQSYRPEHPVTVYKVLDCVLSNKQLSNRPSKELQQVAMVCAKASM